MSTTYNLVEAGAAVGRTKSAILKAIKRGAISASRNPVTGGWSIEPAELHRAFLQVSQTSGNRHDIRDTGDTRDTRDTGKVRLLLEVERTKTAGLEARLSDMAGVNDDLRRRLDTATGQLGEALQQVRVLTDQRVAQPAPEPPRSARRWFLGWRR